MNVKRLRVFAGPNGSGKTTIINELNEGSFFGVYVNADDIEKEIFNNGFLSINPYKISPSIDALQWFFKNRAFSPVKLNDAELWKQITIDGNNLYLKVSQSINSYIAADIAEFIRQSLLESDISFTFETVMSHSSKLDFIRKAKEKGYRIYLYYIATEDPDININRVKIRVAQDGHQVDSEIIRKRYFRSLENLKAAIKLSDRGYIFDNSGQVSMLLAEVTDGSKVEIYDEERIPNWFVKYVVD